MNELITLEINSKNKQELIDLLTASKLVVEIMNEHNTFSVVRPDEGTPATRVVNAKSEQGLAYATAWDKQTTPQHAVGAASFNYSMSETT